MSKDLKSNSKIDTRIWWLMLGRAAFATLLLAGAVSLQVQRIVFFPETSTFHLYRMAFAFYLMSVVYVFLLRVIDREQVNIYIQSLCDVILVSALVYFTGGSRSIYSAFYPMIIIYSVLFLGRRGGLIAASASGILYGLLVDMEYYSWIEPPTAFLVQDVPLTPGEALTRSFVHILSFFLIALLASFVVKQEKKLRMLLDEKQTAFDHLDVLHRSIIESVDAGILTMNLAGQIKSFNRAAERITGHVLADLMNRPLQDAFPVFAEIVDKENDPEFFQGKRKEVDLAFQRRDGERLVLGCTLSSLRNTRGERIGSIVIFHDLTAVKKMQEEYENNRRLAFIGEMAAILAHEMRNPLASISGSIQVLKQDLQLNAADEKLMQIILRGKDQIENFMKDFLLLARPSPGEREKVDLRKIAGDVVESVRYVADWHEGIRIRLSGEGSAVIHGNRAEMRQLIWNLLMNSVQAIREAGEVEISVSESSGPDGVTMTIRDTGAGMPREILQKVFEPFYTNRERGTGLGLAIVNRIVENHGGSIRLESNPGQGTTVTVCLPFHSEPSHQSAEAAGEVTR